MEKGLMQPLEIFYCYAREDHALRNELDQHLTTLIRTGPVKAWYDGEIVPGVSWEEEIETHLNTADIILLLISQAFIKSDYCYSKEMEHALKRYHAGEARVVPILLRPVDWENTPFSKLQMLPSDAHPVTLWADRDEAFEDVAKGIRKVVCEVLSQRQQADTISSEPLPPTQQPVPVISTPSRTRGKYSFSHKTILRLILVLVVLGGLGGVSYYITYQKGIQAFHSLSSPTRTMLPLQTSQPTKIAPTTNQNDRSAVFNRLRLFCQLLNKQNGYQIIFDTLTTADYRQNNPSASGDFLFAEKGGVKRCDIPSLNHIMLPLYLQGTTVCAIHLETRDLHAFYFRYYLKKQSDGTWKINNNGSASQQDTLQCGDL
jgi:hypothetical protein